jgi:hypothetical protein
MPATLLLSFLAAAAFSANAVGSPGNPVTGKCQGTHGPGDRIVCYITFKGDPEFTALTLSFNAEAVQDPGELPISFVLDKSRKIAPGTYEVSDTLPFATSGRCYLFSIMAGRGPGVYRDYIYGREFFNRIAIHFSDQGLVDEPAHEPTFKLDEPKIVIPLQPIIPSPIVKRVAAPATPINPVKPSGKLVEVGPPPRGPSPNLFPQFRSLRGRSMKRPCEAGHQPGSKVTCYVRFAGPSAFTTIYLSFSMQRVPSDQSGLCGAFMFRESKKIGRRTYRVTGVLPPCANGSYLLSNLVAFTLTGMRSYQEGIDFINKFPAVRLDNRNQTFFPDILAIGDYPRPQE